MKNYTLTATNKEGSQVLIIGCNSKAGALSEFKDLKGLKEPKELKEWVFTYEVQK